MAHVQRTSFDERDVEQSIAALKRGAYLLKYGRRGKPKFCPFRLSTKVQHELLSVYATQLLEKEHSGCHALLRDDKVEDLSRMYRLFSKIPRGLDPVSSIFKQHVTAEGTALVKQAEDAASNKKGFLNLFKRYGEVTKQRLDLAVLVFFHYAIPHFIAGGKLIEWVICTPSVYAIG